MARPYSGFHIPGMLAWALLGSVGAAQEAPRDTALQRVISIAPRGTFVRVRPPADTAGRQARWREGVVDEWVGDTVFIWLDVRERKPFSVRGPFFVEANPSGRASRGWHALFGALVGGAVSAFGYVVSVKSSCSHSSNDLCGLAIIATPIAAAAGALAGGIIGAVVPAENWVSLRPGR